MKVSYSAQLMEESVFRHLNHLERSGYRSDYDEFHSLADPIYELPEDDREVAFEKVNRLFFLEKLKLGDHVLRALEAVGLIPKRKRTSRKSALLQANNEELESPAELKKESTDTAEEDETESEAVAVMEDDSNPEESPATEENNDEIAYDLAREFEERIKEVVVKRAINKVDEGSNVLNRVSGDLPTIEMRVLASRFANTDEKRDLEAFLVHEFMHARDMVDHEFDYEDSYIPGNPSVKNLITSRFRLLWNIYVDFLFRVYNELFRNSLLGKFFAGIWWHWVFSFDY